MNIFILYCIRLICIEKKLDKKIIIFDTYIFFNHFNFNFQKFEIKIINSFIIQKIFLYVKYNSNNIYNL